MKKKLLDLLAKKRGIVDRMRQADAAGDQTAFDAALAENTAVDAEIARVKAIMEAEENVPAEPEGVPTSGTDPPAAEPVNSRECVHAFAECIRAQARGQRAAFESNADVLRRAMAAENAGAMTEGVEADGGLLVPQDIQTRINELRRSLVPLSDLFAVENVSFLSGSRVVDTAPNKGFTKIDEMDEIPQDDKPAFRKIAYKVEDYALILPVSNDLLRDTDEALLAYISRWLAKKQVTADGQHDQYAAGRGRALRRVHDGKFLPHAGSLHGRRNHSPRKGRVGRPDLPQGCEIRVVETGGRQSGISGNRVFHLRWYGAELYVHRAGRGCAVPCGVQLYGVRRAAHVGRVQRGGRDGRDRRGNTGRGGGGRRRTAGKLTA